VHADDRRRGREHDDIGARPHAPSVALAGKLDVRAIRERACGKPLTAAVRNSG
jgi:hypothetical protein